MPQSALIYNPYAGALAFAGQIEQVAAFWRKRGWQVIVHPTQYPGQATALASQAASSGAHLVLAAGGDGTLSEVANGLAGTPTALGILPTGTGNCLAQELLLPHLNPLRPQRLLDISQNLAAGRVQSIDLGVTYHRTGTGRYWLLWTSAGSDSYLIERIEPRPRWSKKLGRLGYALQIMAIIAQRPLPRMRAVVEIDGRRYTDEYLAVIIGNGRRYLGGLVDLSPHSALDDGRFEIALLPGSGRRRLLGYLLSIDGQGQLCHPDILRLEGRVIEIHTSPVLPYQTDGDLAGQTPLRCEVKPAALRLLVPQTTPASLFTRPGKPLIS